MTVTNAWMALVGVAVLAFAGCAAGALDCSVFRPVGLAASLGAAGVSLLDRGEGGREESSER